MEGKEKLVLDVIKKANKPMRPRGISNLTGLDKKEVAKILAKLKKDGKIISPKRCFYQVKEV